MDESNPFTPVMAIVVPCYNEQEVLAASVNVLRGQLDLMAQQGLAAHTSYICLVDDGSRDNTWKEIARLSSIVPGVKGKKLSTNFGHQNALLAGLFSEVDKADVFVTIDADLQDDPSVISNMVAKFREGNRIVYGVRVDRQNDSVLKRNTAHLFYRLMHRLGVKTVYNHADFRFCDRQVLRSLMQFNEVNLFLRGIFPLMGFKSDVVEYQRKNRAGGQTKYPFRKMVSFAWQGITSFNASLLRLVTVIGVVMFFLSIVLGVWAFLIHLNGETIRGWTSLLIVFAAFSGINMACLGIVGEYVAKVYQEVKQRPRYIIEDETNML